MIRNIRNIKIIFFPVCFLLLSGLCLSQNKNVEIFTISEPGTITIQGLFKEADIVALVKVVSGDSEHYQATIYKATVLGAFKGVKDNEQIYFGPYISYGIGSEYFVFLKKSGKSVGEMISKDNVAKAQNFDPAADYLRIMYEGYSILPVSYECAFEEKPEAQRCDYAVKINTYHVPLPKSLNAYTVENNENSDKKFVRKTVLEEFLTNLKSDRK
jgi:hypothetical protein